MKRNFILTISLLFVLLVGGCNKPEEQGKTEINIQATPERVVVGNEATKTTLTITAERDWGIYSNAEWCRVSPTGGIAGTTAVSVSVDENKSNGRREATLTIRAGSASLEVAVVQNYEVVAVEVADAAFQAALLASYDSDADGVLSTIEAAAIKSMEVASKGIASLAGLEKFAGLERLDCSGNSLSEIELSGVPQLRALNCSKNSIGQLNIRQNLLLAELDCRENPLTEILVWTNFKAPDGFKIPDGAKYVEPEIPTPAGYKLVWQDEFNTPGRSLPDNSKWWYETGGGGWGNNEKQTYVSGRRDKDTIAMVSDGTLKITAKKVGGEVLSVRMNTVEGWTYGYFEASLKLPVGKGTWPAFWMMPKNFRAWPDDGEIDIMEHVGYHPNYVSSSIHCKAYYHSIGTQKTHEIYKATAQKEFHTYACEWTEDYVRFFFDGELHFTFENDHKNNYNTWPFYNPFYLKLNLAWGGNWGGAMGLDEGCLPATYEIDYVRVFKRE